MVPKVKLATIEQIVAALKGVPNLEGSSVGDAQWEGHTGRQVRVDVIRQMPGFSVLWEYHDIAGDKHQCGKRSVQTKQIADIVSRITAADLAAVPSRFVESVEADTARIKDPILTEAAGIILGQIDEADEIEPTDPALQAMADDAAQRRADDEEWAQLQAEEEAYKVSLHVPPEYSHEHDQNVEADADQGYTEGDAGDSVLPDVGHEEGELADVPPVLPEGTDLPTLGSDSGA